ncbi:UDP-3-O-acyl-N-acetylglucosamine deacetylase [Desulfurivibrio alkaliphilus]|uniref:UDP-3-O-acyl-N-acetylglucosamine deacetylase n=1 Tax=Desulfurivibrio alkaliphilus (strain DSM 19089 / UNIQEM U267 / AHT2) TaxID=589865 RepID=D6Z2J8_DESAT|nr:UDP-3-O-acyl-N-acetylglucosamine deacetylase [Desulfurivibrio alkaliphilus]ADH85773.1 UDP-3-0-acyl N-acetylglucosamine deacetylase [Desulfurivibrio alkaliphilus AHT 2]
MDALQHTLKKSVSFAGIGLHSGKPVRMAIYPDEVNSGIRLLRSDLGQLEPTPAFMDRVVDTRLATTVETVGKASVSTVEHVLAALYGLGIDNAVIVVDGPEVPIMDGSAAPFVRVLRRVGRRRQQARRWMLKFNREVCFQDDQGRSVRIEPYSGFQVDCRIDFAHAEIGSQQFEIDLTPHNFATEIAGARTFGFFREVEQLRKNGLALGGSLDNAVVINDQGVMNSDGLRYADEFVRHKVLDLVGDLALLGFPLLGRVVAEKSGHGQHLGLMQAVSAHPEAWDIVALENGGEYRVLQQLAESTKAVGDRILPYLLPPSLALSPARG